MNGTDAFQAQDGQSAKNDGCAKIIFIFRIMKWEPKSAEDVPWKGSGRLSGDTIGKDYLKQRTDP